MNKFIGNMTKKQKKDLKIILISAALYAAVLIICGFMDFQEILGRWGGLAVEFVLFAVPYAIISKTVYKKAWSNIKTGDIFDENFLMLVATVGAIGTGEFSEAVAVMLFYQVGELFQSIAVNKSRQSVSELMDIMPEYANLVKENGEIVEIDPDDALVGETIVVKPGERIPLDCRVKSGESMIDTSALTGESVPRRAAAGNEIISGCINGEGVLYAEVMKTYDNSTVARILELVESASEKKAPTEKFITRFARYYTPAVVFAAIALAFIPPFFTGGLSSLSVWLYRACTFLVVSCPCALVISVPMSFFGGIGAASNNGILVKGSNYLEALAKMETIVFDKTGTLTKGEFKVTSICPENGISEAELLNAAAAAESFSTHPIAAAVRAKAAEFSETAESLQKAGTDDTDGATEISGELKNTDGAKYEVKDVSETAGHGVKALVNGRTVYAGNEKLMNSIGIDVSTFKEKIAASGAESAGTVIFTAFENEFVGYIIIADSVKETAPEAIARLKKLGVKQTVMLTGDKREAAKAVAEETCIDTFCAELLPADKVGKVEELLENQKAVGKGAKLAFVGDGINDAPVLMRSDIGIAMGRMGSDAAIEAADVVIMDDNIARVSLAVKIARKTMRIVRQNIIFAIGVKFAILIMTAFGYANMWWAVFGDVGVAIIAILNAMRALYIKED